MNAVFISFFVALYPGLAIAMHFLLKAAARRPLENDRVDTRPVVGQPQAAKRVGGINMAPFAGWSTSTTPPAKAVINQHGMVVPFASWN